MNTKALRVAPMTSEDRAIFDRVPVRAEGVYAAGDCLDYASMRVTLEEFPSAVDRVAFDLHAQAVRR